MDVVGDLLPFLAMVLVQFGFAGMNITSKLAMDSGMKPLVLVSYRQIFATIAMVPFAYFFEWKTRPKITKALLLQIFICSLTGVTGNQVFYFIGLENSTPTIGCALTNILPAVTFILAVVLRQESVGLKKISGQAKLLGTIICVGGAMLLSFYHGAIINVGESSIHWKYADEMGSSNSASKSNFILGPLLIMFSSVCWAIWFTLQAGLLQLFMQYVSKILCLVDLSCEFFETFTCQRTNHNVIPGSCMFCSSIFPHLMEHPKKGALYVSVFSPLLLVIVAVLSWALLREKLYVGTAVGSVMIVAGLYAVLWGKEKEMKLKAIEAIEAWKEGGKEEKGDLELQLPANSNSRNAPAAS
ncbi:hypothetical protein GH714_026430 [Hevea brasiliensis]|uniref:WAT1-related protein n=1 Tax=Hevea brasiliensis TaxID=3981 RepID=A0A6A6M4Y3_HEVBR|nr:hypothetical protein GH714_026430 [Hevea brasiliensis]